MESILLFDEAFSRICEQLPSWSSETVPVRSALWRVCAKNVLARVDVPPFSRSMMDGYAVSSEDTERGSNLEVTGRIAAGQPAAAVVSPGIAVRVMTGAPVPEGAAAVVRDEWCETDEHGHVKVLKSVVPGESIQPAGDDGRRGSTLVHQGCVLSALEIAVLQTFGVHEIEVTRKPRATLLITGTELVQDAQQSLKDGQIYGTNDILLKAALEQDGILVTSVEYVADNQELLEHSLRRASETSDLILVTGGVSVGDFDYTPAAIRNIGSTIHIRKILMRPGSPFLFATRGDTAIFGLSGNPAACFAQFSVLVRPAVRRALGIPDTPFPNTGILSHDLSQKPIKHTRVQRGKVYIEDGKVMVDCQLSQSSGVVSSLLETSGYIRLDESELKAGTIVPLRFVRPL